MSFLDDVKLADSFNQSLASLLKGRKVNGKGALERNGRRQYVDVEKDVADHLFPQLLDRNHKVSTDVRPSLSTVSVGEESSPVIDMRLTSREVTDFMRCN